MPNSVVTLSSSNQVLNSAIDNRTATYYLSAAIGAGNYQAGGIAVSFAGVVTAFGAPVEVRFRSVSTPLSVYDYKYVPNAQNFAVITNLALTSNVVTITANNLFKAGDVVALSGLTTSTFLNGQQVTVISTGLSGTQFEFNFTHANVSSGAETGSASKGSASQSSGALQIFTAGSEVSAGATPAAVVADVVQCIAVFAR